MVHSPQHPHVVQLRCQRARARQEPRQCGGGKAAAVLAQAHLLAEELPLSDVPAAQPVLHAPRLLHLWQLRLLQERRVDRPDQAAAEPRQVDAQRARIGPQGPDCNLIVRMRMHQHSNLVWGRHCLQTPKGRSDSFASATMRHTKVAPFSHVNYANSHTRALHHVRVHRRHARLKPLAANSACASGWNR